MPQKTKTTTNINSHIVFYIMLFCLLLCWSGKQSYASDARLSSYPVVQTFINKMVQQHQFNANELTTLLDSTQLNADIIQSMQHPYEEQPWYVYQKHLVNQKRIMLGVEYWKNHEKALNYAEKKYGVPAEIIVAIIGIESLYGHAHLKHPVLNTLATLGFSYTPRTAFFQNELEQFLLLARELNVNPKSIYGSYAGAIGLPQFMPSSYRRFAIAYNPTFTSNSDNDSEVGNLFNDTDDVIVSVANYLNYFGWQKKQKVAIPAQITGDEYQELLPTKLEPSYRINKLKKYGIKSTYQLPKATKATLIKLQNENSYEYWLGLNNFHVISRYNGNIQYIMAVDHLANEIKQQKTQASIDE